MSHVANGDTVTMGLLQGVVNTFVYFFASIVGYVVDRVLLRSSLVLSILTSMIVMWFSRYREFHADAGVQIWPARPR